MCSFQATCRPSEVAAILVEPIQGEGGYLVPPDGFLAGLRALCDRHGILLIFDEVQTGIGRTGKMFASQHWGVAPDIMTLAKGLGSGLPIGLVVAKKTLMEKWKRGAHGNTYGGNPLCCAAALATLELVRARVRCQRRRQWATTSSPDCARCSRAFDRHRRRARQGTHDRHRTGDRPAPAASPTLRCVNGY